MSESKVLNLHVIELPAALCTWQQPAVIGRTVWCVPTAYVAQNKQVPNGNVEWTIWNSPNNTIFTYHSNIISRSSVGKGAGLQPWNFAFVFTKVHESRLLRPGFHRASYTCCLNRSRQFNLFSTVAVKLALIRLVKKFGSSNNLHADSRVYISHKSSTCSLWAIEDGINNISSLPPHPVNDIRCVDIEDLGVVYI